MAADWLTASLSVNHKPWHNSMLVNINFNMVISSRVEYRYNAVVFSHNTHNRRPKAVRVSYGSHVVSSNLSKVLTFSYAFYMQYGHLFDRIVSRVYCTYSNPEPLGHTAPSCSQCLVTYDAVYISSMTLSMVVHACESFRATCHVSCHTFTIPGDS